MLGDKILMIVEVSWGPGERMGWKGVGSLRGGKLKDTDMWRARRTGKEWWRQDQFWAILNSEIPPLPVFCSFSCALSCCHVTSSS